jgi:hypothetical protein
MNEIKLFEEDWIVLNFSLGDIINQILYLESNANFSYGIICRERNLDFTKFILEFLSKIIKLKFNGKIAVYNFPEHGFFTEYDIYYIEESDDINNHSKNGRFKTVHAWPNVWYKYIDKNIVEKIYKEFNFKKESEKKILFFTTSTNGQQVPLNFWNSISKITHELGYKNYTNRTSKLNIYWAESNIENSTSLFLNFHELVDFINNNDVILIGLRSGIFDFLKFTPNKKIMFYQSEPDWLFKHGNLKNDISAKNSIDLNYPFDVKNISYFL